MKYIEVNVNTVPKINCDEQNDISILKTQLFDIKKKLLAYDDVDEILYDAIEEQNWFTFKNKPQVVFDRRIGFLYLNLLRKIAIGSNNLSSRS